MLTAVRRDASHAICSSNRRRRQVHRGAGPPADAVVDEEHDARGGRRTRSAVAAVALTAADAADLTSNTRANDRRAAADARPSIRSRAWEGSSSSCVAENGDRWYQEAHNLVLSIRRFGGGLSTAPVVVNFVDAVEPRYESGLAELDAEVRVVPRFDRRTPASNKLRMLELADTHQFDVLLAIDTDTLVVGDVSRYADARRASRSSRRTATRTRRVLARPVRRPRHPRAEPLARDDEHRAGHVPVLQQRRPVRAPRTLRPVAGELDEAGLRRPRPLRAPARHRAGRGAPLDEPARPRPRRDRRRHPRGRACPWRPTCRRRWPSIRCSPTRSRHRSSSTTTTRWTPTASSTGRGTRALNPLIDAFNRQHAAERRPALPRPAAPAAGPARARAGSRAAAGTSAGRSPTCAATGCSRRCRRRAKRLAKGPAG